MIHFDCAESPNKKIKFETNESIRNLINKKDIITYPMPNDKRFHEKIDKIIQQNVKEKQESTLFSTKKFSLMEHQEQIPYIFNLSSFSRSILLLCEMGSGKTILVIGMIENMKSFLKMYNTRALILVPNNLIENVFYNELMGKYEGKYEKRVTGNEYVKKEQREQLNDTNNPERKKLEKSILKKISHVYEINTHKKWEQYVSNLSDEQIKTEFSNRIIVVDEIHKAKNEHSNLYQMLNRVLHLAQNIWFIGMNADKFLIDNPRELCQYINLLHTNNTKSQKRVLTSNDIDKLYSDDVIIKKKAEKKLEKVTRGLIVYASGHHPRWFPTRVDVGYTQLQVNELFKCNTTNASGDSKLIIDKMPTVIHNHDDEQLLLRPVPLKNSQKEAYILSYISEFMSNKDIELNEMWQKSRKYCRALFTEKEKMSNIFDALWEDSLHLKGPIAVYCFFVEEGMYWFEEYLQSKGVKPFTDTLNKSDSQYFFNFARYWLHTDSYVAVLRS